MIWRGWWWCAQALSIFAAPLPGMPKGLTRYVLQRCIPLPRPRDSSILDAPQGRSALERSDGSRVQTGLADLYLIADALAGWLRLSATETAAYDRWMHVWAQTPDQIRQSLDMPRSVKGDRERTRVFSARAFCGTGGKLSVEVG